MRIDKTHRHWGTVTAALFVTCLAGYSLYALRFRNGPAGGSLAGLIFGGAGYALMIFAALLSLRKKFTTWRIGRAQTWMRGHLWLGLLSYPLIFFHAGITFGHDLTFALMVIFSLVILTGIVGAILQHYFPLIMTEQVERETIYYQIDRILGQLKREADSLLIPLFHKDTQYGLLVPVTERTHATTTTAVALGEEVKLLEAYEKDIKPYLEQRGAYQHLLNHVHRARGFFADLRMTAPEAIQPIIHALESICDEKRDLDRQSRLHRILHAWLLVHVPLAFALIVLGGIHAVMALRYV